MNKEGTTIKRSVMLAGIAVFLVISVEMATGSTECANWLVY